MNGYEKDLLIANQNIAKELKKANELKKIELELKKIEIASSLLDTEKPFEPVENLFQQLHDILIR